MSERRAYGGKNANAGATPEATHYRTILNWILRKRMADRAAKYRKSRAGMDDMFPQDPEARP